jgi:sulfur carrier protein
MSGITVNGEARGDAPATLRQLVEAEGLDPDRRGLAVARNGRVVPRQDWEQTELQTGDAIEIVKPFAGG